MKKGVRHLFSPLPPARTGVADYSAALLTALRGSELPVPLYHLGNNQLHRRIYRRALEIPGVVVLHDAVLHHFLLGSLDERAYLDEFVYNYGEWNRGVARELYAARAGSAADPRYFAWPMLRRVVERARAIIVHNPAAREIVLRHVPSAHVIEIPHLFVPPLPETSRFRELLDIPAGAFLFGMFGYLRESKRLLPVLRAFTAVQRDRVNMYLLVAGDFASSDLKRAAAPGLAHRNLRRLPYLAERDFWRAASAVDACINLRYPAAGETSGITIRLMGIGKPVLLTAGPETSAFPDDAVIRIPAGVAEEPALRDYMSLLASFPWIAAETGKRGAGYIAAHHSVERVAELYWKVLCDHSGSS